MAEENISQEFRLKTIDETRNYLIEETIRNDLMSKKPKKVCTTLSYIERFLILSSTITRCVSISAFASLVGIPMGILRKKKKKHSKIVLLAKSKLNSIDILISKPLIDSVISHDEFVLINNVLKEYNKMKEEIKYLKA